MLKVVNHPTTGEKLTFVKTVTDNQGVVSDWFKMRIDSQEVVLKGGVAQKSNRTAFVVGPKDLLQLVETQFINRQVGRIKRVKTLEPQYAGHKEALNPKTGELLGCYYTFEYSAEGQPDVDSTTAPAIMYTAIPEDEIGG
jgi:FKBP-type peptidyl-prolyl cis-trans isomerase 2